MLYRTSTALLILTVALLSWGLVGFFAWTINADESERVAHIQDARIAEVAGANSVRTHALARDTAAESAQLKDLLNVDIVSASYMIEEVGKAAGVSVALGDAMPEGKQSTDLAAVRAVGFVVQADGKFPALMRAARLFETLPIPSDVTRLDIERAPGASSLWHMNVYIRILTTSDISS